MGNQGGLYGDEAPSVFLPPCSFIVHIYRECWALSEVLGPQGQQDGHGSRSYGVGSLIPVPQGQAGNLGRRLTYVFTHSNTKIVEDLLRVG